LLSSYSEHDPSPRTLSIISLFICLFRENMFLGYLFPILPFPHGHLGSPPQSFPLYPLSLSLPSFVWRSPHVNPPGAFVPALVRLCPPSTSSPYKFCLAPPHTLSWLFGCRDDLRGPPVNRFYSFTCFFTLSFSFLVLFAGCRRFLFPPHRCTLWAPPSIFGFSLRAPALRTLPLLPVL